MKKSMFVRRVAEEHNVSVSAAQLWVNAIFKTLVHCVLDEPEVHITGLGKFEQDIKKPRHYVMPNGQEGISTPRTKLKFTPSVHLKTGMEQGLSSTEYERRMEIYRAMKRGETVPGYKFTVNRYGVMKDDEVDLTDEE